jgi:hypothetical protein
MDTADIIRFEIIATTSMDRVILIMFLGAAKIDEKYTE